MNVLPVAYVSQITPGALEHNNDCGAASGLMLLRTYGLGKELSVDQLYNRIKPVGDAGLFAGDIRTELGKDGLNCEWKAGIILHDLFDVLVQRRPVLALIHYAALVKAGLTERTGFLGAHFVVISAIDIRNVAIQDPYRDDGREHMEIPIDVFRQAWTEAQLDANPACAGMIPLLPIQNLSAPEPTGELYEMTANGVNVRSGPGDNYPIVRVIWRAVTPVVRIVKISGDRGNLVEGGWVWMNYFKRKIEPEDLIRLAAED